MKVCFFIPSLGDGGAQRQCIALLNELQHDSDVELHLLLLAQGEHDDRLVAKRLSVHRTTVDNFASPKALLFVVRSLRRIRPDVVISWLHPADIWTYAATRVVPGIPWILTERGSAYPDSFVFNLRKRLGRSAAAAIVANSVAGEQLWQSLGPRSSVRVIPNMLIEPDAVGVGAPSRKHSVNCLFVGRLEPEKNVAAMTAAFARFSGTNREARLIVAGKGSEADQIMRVAADRGASDRVSMLGFRRDISTLMSQARVLLSFSHYEGMPNVIMEAVTAGVPVVVSDIPEHRALLGNAYPFMVQTDWPAERAAEVIAKAWTDGVDRVNDSYVHARAVLAASAPPTIAKAYRDMFADVVARESNTGDYPTSRRIRRAWR